VKSSSDRRHSIAGLRSAPGAIHELLNQADYLETASRLVRLRRNAAPRADGETREDPRAELVRRLLEYQQIKRSSLRLVRWSAGRAAPRPPAGAA
jgi:chromatin segregation and condensation protein Rec8/ScpA/Scc1 (kleisin family)